MYKIMVHIKSGHVWMDSNVCVQISLPGIPRVGDIVHLNQESVEVLESMAKSNLIVASKYAPNWFFHSPEIKEPKEADFQHLSFDDAVTVTDVLWNPNSDVVHIELDA